MIHLRTLTLAREKPLPGEYPFTVPAIRALGELAFTADVTFFVGENGSGKSTLLEGIAAAASLPAVGSEGVDNDPTLSAARALAARLRCAWTKKTRRGFFMRSEDFFGYAKRIAQTRDELRSEMREVETEFAKSSEYARNLATSAFSKELHALQQSYGDGLDAQSHGESYFKLFRARFVPDGLYLLDEPEAPLSPQRQLALIALLHEMVGLGAQFIIATHSPILLAYPGATIFHFADGQIAPTPFADLEHVRLTREFLAEPERFLRHLLA